MKNKRAYAVLVGGDDEKGVASALVLSFEETNQEGQYPVQQQQQRNVLADEQAMLMGSDL